MKLPLRLNNENDIYYNCCNKKNIPDYIRWGALIYTRDFKKIPSIAKNILTKEEVERIMDKIWGYDSDSDINVVWTYISYLRKKLDSLNASLNP